jgi:D-glycero-alpha-D-manno-heptose-7-phosphate kinase
MIISKTPLRVSFVGGGSDLPSYYKYEHGAVFSTTIDKYVYIMVNKKFDGKVRVSYSKTENVDKAFQLVHERIRESLKVVGINSGIEVVSVSDVPSAGTGLGSSSAYVVGVLNALKTYKNEKVNAKYLADTACDIEIKKCKNKIGKQDQFAAAYGGFNKIVFSGNGTVRVTPVELSSRVIKKLKNNLILLYTGSTKSSKNIMKLQSSNLETDQGKRNSMKKMVSLVNPLIKSLQSGDVDSMGGYLDENWALKKQMAKGISSGEVDAWYDLAKKNGALGGKILGAGNRGFLLLYVPEDKQHKVLRSLSELRKFDFDFEPGGSKIVLNDQVTGFMDRS